HNVWTLFGFNLPAFSDSERCTINFSDASSAHGSRRMKLFSTLGCPAYGSTWYNRPSRIGRRGTFQTSASGAGQATVVEDFGLSFDCPTAPTCYGYEVQPVGGGDKVTWNCAGHGFIITAAAP
ncbi:hypothetical protein L873DRAFT_1717150, partial [Choiromyces venosus 120613-1]